MEKHQIALVTEAGNGMGKTFATILQNQGYEVLLGAKGKSHQELEKTDLHGIKLLKMDLTDQQSVDRLGQYIENAHGKLDVLINNAEIANGFGQKINELKIAEVKELFEENFFSVIRAIQGLYGLLSKSENAIIVNVSSSLGEIEKMKDEGFCYADYQMTGYSTAKAALEMLTLLLSKELKPTSISIHNFNPIRLKNCTHNNVVICKGVEEELLQLIANNTLQY